MAQLGIIRTDGESWRDCALRYGRKWGLEAEVSEYFDRFKALGDDDMTAAWAACREWDVCELLPLEKK